MGTLSGPEIIYRVSTGDIAIEPFHLDQVNPNSYNLTLGRTLLVYRRPSRLSRAWRHLRGDPWCLDMMQDNPTRLLEIPDGGRILWPGHLYLGATQEYTATEKFVPVIEGRSSVGRLGLCVHVTAGFGDHGFAANWVLELTTVYPLRVYHDVEICQIVYGTLEGLPRPYCGKYQGQGRIPRASRLWVDFTRTKQRHGRTTGGHATQDSGGQAGDVLATPGQA